MKTFYDDNLKDDVYWVSDTIRLQSVTPMEDYKLLLVFSTGEERIYDVAPLLEKPAFAALKNKELFALAHVEYDTVAWNDDIDLCPEALKDAGDGSRRL